jgi:hypothetical protein
MRILSNEEWVELYRKEWRPRIAHLTKSKRKWFVRQCLGKVGYESRREAWPQMAGLPDRPGTAKGIYRCNLCKFFHIGNSRRRYEWRQQYDKQKAEARSPGPVEE